MTDMQATVVQALIGIVVVGWLLRKILIPHRLLRSRKEKRTRGVIGVLLLCAAVMWWGNAVYSNMGNVQSWEKVALGAGCGAVVGLLIMFGVLRIHTWEI